LALILAVVGAVVEGAVWWLVVEGAGRLVGAGADDATPGVFVVVLVVGSGAFRLVPDRGIVEGCLAGITG
jgi:hypothetical protein